MWSQEYLTYLLIQYLGVNDNIPIIIINKYK